MTYFYKALSAALVIAFSSTIALAQSLVINGLYDCQKATNGRSYCKRQGAPASNLYVPVTEDFFQQYEAVRTGKTVTSAPPVVVSSPVTVTNNVTNNTLVVNLTDDAANLKGQLSVLSKLIEEQQSLKTQGSDPANIDETIAILRERLNDLKSKFHEKTVELSKYSTSIKPDDADLQITARRESEIQTKIPYYIAGTKETGEFWVEPYVSDSGELGFNFQFVDVNSSAANKIISTIKMTPEQLEQTRTALVKAADNSKKAHAKQIRRDLQVRLTCFPAVDCPEEGKKIAGRLSTEVVFGIHDDGSTSVRLQRNKGLYEEAYTVSINSALLLQCYINHVLNAGKAEHEMGSTSTEQLKDLFR